MNKLLKIKEVQPLCTSLSKIPLIMRITLVLLFVFAFNINAEYSYSQSARISMDMKNSSIEKVLQTIEEKSDFYFLYSNRLIDVDRIVRVQVDNVAISSILENIFSSTELTETKQTNKKTITGTIVDSGGETIIGANIIEKGTNNGTITDFDV